MCLSKQRTIYDSTLKPTGPDIGVRISMACSLNKRKSSATNPGMTRKRNHRSREQSHSQAQSPEGKSRLELQDAHELSNSVGEVLGRLCTQNIFQNSLKEIHPPGSH